MKHSQQIIFYITVFTVYGAINYYILKKLLLIIPDKYNKLFIGLFLFVVLSYFAGRSLENLFLNHLTDFLIWIGSIWIAVMFYTLLCLLFIDILRLINYAIPFFPSFIKLNPLKTKKLIALMISVLVTIMVAGGFINSKIFYIKKLNLFVNKSAGNVNSLNIVAASDLHLGTINGNNFAWRVVEKINSLNPDIILLAGDIIDEDIEPILRENVGETLKLLKAKYGVYAVTGNHEYIGGIKESTKYLVDHEINLLRDSIVFIDSSFYVIGREDLSISRFSGNERNLLKDIIKNTDKSFPTIMLDHQPFRLNEAQESGIDLQISGHTHNGQLWPLNYITEKIYELSWGYLRKGETNYYVSCGIGGWGPPVRIGSRPEIVNIKLRFRNN